MNDKRPVAVLEAFLAGLLLSAWPAGAADPELKYVVIVSRHGVRSPTWNNARLNAYSAEPWPEWEVPPGYLTPHGRKLIELIGSYYREWLTSQHLLHLADARTQAKYTSARTRISARWKPAALFRNRCSPAAESTSIDSPGTALTSSSRASGLPTPSVCSRRCGNGSVPIRKDF